MKLEPKEKSNKTLKELSEEFHEYQIDFLKRLDKFEEASRKTHLMIGTKK